MRRLTWDETWLEVALTIAKRSRCVRSQVGCVIVTADNQVLATGYNGPPAGMDVDGNCSHWCPRAQTGGSLSYDDCVAAHDAMNALRFAGRDAVGGTAYTTRVPCFMCAKALANSGIVRLVYRPDQPEDAERQPDRSLELLQRCGVECAPLTPYTPHLGYRD